MQKKTYAIKAWGCAMNLSDAERIKTVMEAAGFSESDDRPDIAIFVACSVRQSAIDRVWGKIQNSRQNTINNKQETIQKPLLVLTGCVLEADKKKFDKLVDIVMNIKDIEQLPDKIDQKRRKAGAMKRLSDGSNDFNYFHISPARDSDFSALVAIMTGCNNFCAYCAVPYTRGRECSRPVAEILSEVGWLVKKGYREIILLGQNVNSYGYTGFAKLLKKINAIQGNFWIRFFTSHPKDLSDELIAAMAECDKVCKYINLPVQAGDNAVLTKMNRKYTVGHYKKLVKKLRTAMPNIAISTDIIVGFPGETKKQFENSARLFRETKYDMAYIAQYSPRPGTAAARLKNDVSREEKKQREKILTEILKKTALKNNMAYIDRVEEVLVEKKLKDNQYMGKTRSYKHVTFESEKNLIGELIQVKIDDDGPWGLRGKIIGI